MKGWTKLLVALPFVLIGGHATAQVAGEISQSPHDLSSGDPLAADKNEVCVYCHTPHGARSQTGAGGIQAPLWNKPESTAPAGYTAYDSSTLDGDVAQVGSVSIACLTCHDGTQAPDVVINAPGTGGFNAAGTSLGTATALTGIAALGTDLTNDHPIGIQYGSDAGDPDFIVMSSLDIDGDGNLDYWVDTDVGAAGTREKTDMILYTRTGDETTPRVECASCHDPHVGSADDVAGVGTNADGSDISFMRISNDSSDVCLACHTK